MPAMPGRRPRADHHPGHASAGPTSVSPGASPITADADEANPGSTRV